MTEALRTAQQKSIMPGHRMKAASYAMEMETALGLEFDGDKT